MRTIICRDYFILYNDATISEYSKEGFVANYSKEPNYIGNKTVDIKQGNIYTGKDINMIARTPPIFEFTLLRIEELFCVAHHRLEENFMSLLIPTTELDKLILNRYIRNERPNINLEGTKKPRKKFKQRREKDKLFISRNLALS